MGHYMKYSSKLEWEFLQEEKNLITFEITNDISIYSIKSCYLKRGENFEIILDIVCELDNRNSQFYNETWTAEFVFENYREIIKLTHCRVKEKSVSVGPNDGYHLIFHVDTVEVFYKHHDFEDETCYIKEWYLNSIHDNLVFTRPTRYNVASSYTKVRDNSPCDDISFTEESPQDSSRDHLFLELNDFNVILQKVPDEFGPDWSKNLGIEYHKEYNIPSADIRKKVSQIVSFLLGRNLIKVGETYYDSKWNIVGNIAISSNVSSRLNLKTISNYVSRIKGLNCFNPLS